MTAQDRPAPAARAPLRVAHVIHSLQPGGAEGLLVDLAGVSADVGIELLVVSIMRTDDSPYAARLRRLGVPVADLGRTSRWDPRALQLGVQVLRAFAPDVVHSHLKHADLVGAVTARRLRVPLVSTLHVIEDRPGPGGRLKRRAAAAARISTAARTVAVSQAQRRWYLEAFRVDPATVVTVPNGVADVPPLPDGPRAALRAELGAAPGAVLCANVGIMRPGKGQADLLAALALLGDDPPLRVAMVGDGPLRPALTGQARHAGLLDRVVHFTGYRHDVGAVLCAADLVVSASRAEALPTVLLQALAAGRPVVATDVGGVPEVVGDAEAVLVPAADPQALAAALHDLAGDAGARRRLGRAGRERYEEKFSVRRWAERLRALYLEVLDGR